MFKVLRNDADILVISNKYVDELRALPDEKASAIGAHIKVSQLEFSASAIVDRNWLLYRICWVNTPPRLFY